MKEMNIVEVAPIRDQVADILRKRIISGDLANGEKLSERQISTELNISTTPVKEAFRLLQAEGLIVHPAEKGIVRLGQCIRACISGNVTSKFH